MQSGREGLGGSSSNGNAGRFAGELVPTDDGSGDKPPGGGNGDDGGGGGGDGYGCDLFMRMIEAVANT